MITPSLEMDWKEILSALTVTRLSRLAANAGMACAILGRGLKYERGGGRDPDFTAVSSFRELRDAIHHRST